VSLRFVLCVERGRLEGEALLLCESIRRFAGRLAHAPISAYRPRAGDPLADATYAALDDLDVELVEEPLNRESASYGIANKLYSSRHAEANSTEDVLVMVDSDSVFLAEPSELELSPEFDIAARPVGRVGNASRGPGHRNEAYWQRLYEMTGVRERPWVRTSVDRKRIRGYWNSGLVATRREAGLMREWAEVFEYLVRERHSPREGLIDELDQVALAVVISRRPERLRRLPGPYNYRITRRAMHSEKHRGLDLSELVHVHYMRSFYIEGFLERLEPPVRRDTEQFRWLSERLPLEPSVRLDAADGELEPAAFGTPEMIRRLPPELRRHRHELPPAS
jgi:hypothetical protein